MARLLHPLPEVCEQLSIGRSTLYELIAAGVIRTVKIGRRTLISHDEMGRYVHALTANPGDLLVRPVPNPLLAEPTAERASVEGTPVPGCADPAPRLEVARGIRVPRE